MKPVPYVPEYRLKGSRLDVPSAWKGIEGILPCLMVDFDVKHDLALEFGVEYGFSAYALAGYFSSVYAVDHFLGLGHNGNEFYHSVRKMLPEKIVLFQERWQDFTETFTWSRDPDLIHIDIDHNYEDTYAAGEWAVQHAPVVLVHDTLSYSNVMKACSDLADKYDRKFWNFEEYHGLGILVQK